MQHWTVEWFRGSVLHALFTLLAVWDGGVKEQWIVYDAHALSYEELNSRARRLASQLGITDAAARDGLVAMISV
eukprot:1010927-Prymnesium_polylepis.1